MRDGWVSTTAAINVRSGVTVPAGGEPKKNGGANETYRVVPVEELEAVAGAELEGVGPRSPAEHAENHKDKRDVICLREKHSGGPAVVFWCNWERYVADP